MKKILPAVLCLLLLCACGNRETQKAALSEEEFYKTLPEYFTFASGVGGWSTELEIAEDGSFTGIFHDSDMGDTGEAYPDGTVYLCNFTGKLTDFACTDERTYTVKVGEITLDEEPGKEEIDGNIRFVYSTPYGINEGDEMCFYLPGTPLKGLPEEYVEWISMPMAWGEEDRPETLPFCGLYNLTTQEGFFS